VTEPEHAHVQWRDVPVGAVVMYGMPREVLVNDPWGGQRTVMLDGIPAIYPRATETVQVIDGGAQ
jgi:hypothetical protein